MKRLHNHSPWIYQLKRSRRLNKLKRDTETDITIIGGGIAGITTAYFLLTRTRHKVTLVEAGRVAHGATGHNAGQLASYFERPFNDIAKEFGLKQAAEAQKALYSSWNLIEQIRKKACLETELAIFTGYAGLTSIEQINQHLHNKHLREQAGIKIEKIYLSDELNTKQIPKKYGKLYTTVPHAKILQLLETNDTRFQAALASKKGCMNSAFFTEEIAGYLLTKYKERFKIYENSPVKKIMLFEKHALLHVSKNTILTNKVIMCTNGFENIKIENVKGKNINKKFHEQIHGLIGFMAGYIEHQAKTPTAISYFRRKTARKDESYYYFTRRYFEKEKKSHHTLICAGGPDMHLAEKAKYQKHKNYKPKAYEALDNFLKTTYNQYPCGQANYRFKWHGLMGYTKTRIRIIGPEPKNPTLLYNLGCNGVGIMSSIYASNKITDIILGKKQKKSIFDPQQ